MNVCLYSVSQLKHSECDSKVALTVLYLNSRLNSLSCRSLNMYLPRKVRLRYMYECMYVCMYVCIYVVVHY